MISQFERVCRIRSECLVLKKLADEANLPMLSHLLDMAALEAVHHEMALQIGEPPTIMSTTLPPAKIRAIA